MNEKEKAKKILKILNTIYPKTPIPLKHKNKFTLLTSVLLSAQCTDKRVNTITKKLFKYMPVVDIMAEASIDAIFDLK